MLSLDSRPIFLKIDDFNSACPTAAFHRQLLEKALGGVCLIQYVWDNVTHIGCRKGYFAKNPPRRTAHFRTCSKPDLSVTRRALSKEYHLRQHAVLRYLLTRITQWCGPSNFYSIHHINYKWLRVWTITFRLA